MNCQNNLLSVKGHQTSLTFYNRKEMICRYQEPVVSCQLCWLRNIIGDPLVHREPCCLPEKHALPSELRPVFRQCSLLQYYISLQKTFRNMLSSTLILLTLHNKTYFSAIHLVIMRAFIIRISNKSMYLPRWNM